MDEICDTTEEQRPRMYHQEIRQDFLRLSKSKKRSAKAVRSAIKNQLQYIHLDVGWYIVQFVQNSAKLTENRPIVWNLATTVYKQQRIMFDSRDPHHPTEDQP